MTERARRNDKVRWQLGRVVDAILEQDGQVSGLRLRAVDGGATSDLAVTGAFVAIGHDPNTAVLAGQVELDEAGYVRLHQRTSTSVEGVFAAGDVADHVYRQAVTAAGSGCAAAIDCERWLAAQA
jgi:thioredoxin reductase (NADPH)